MIDTQRPQEIADTGLAGAAPAHLERIFLGHLRAVRGLVKGCTVHQRLLKAAIN